MKAKKHTKTGYINKNLNESFQNMQPGAVISRSGRDTNKFNMRDEVMHLNANKNFILEQ